MRSDFSLKIQYYDERNLKILLVLNISKNSEPGKTFNITNLLIMKASDNDAGRGRLNRDREIFISPVQLTTSRIGNLSRLIHTLLYGMTVHESIYIYIYT